MILFLYILQQYARSGVGVLHITNFVRLFSLNCALVFLLQVEGPSVSPQGKASAGVNYAKRSN